jgi:3-hydroxyacyl-CoA dehydrogenase
LNFQKICVIGLGYIGLPTASTFAAHGLRVLGVDISPRVRAQDGTPDLRVRARARRRLHHRRAHAIL